MIMTEEDYDQLFRQLTNLQIEAPCHNGTCIGHEQCEYGITGCYGRGSACAINIVREEAVDRYCELIKQKI